MRRAARVDDNHPDIVTAFEALGCTVLSLAAMGKGCPDLLIGCDLSNYLVEVKNPNQDPCKRKLTPDEMKFQKMWRGQWSLIENVQDVPSFVKAWRRDK
jgi:Holliday junction resolvase